MVETFETNPKEIDLLLKEISEGVIQLPDFQRDWVWDDSHIISLLASISQSFPIGAILMLETGENTRFKPRTIEGVTSTNKKADFLILDGQQRLTSLFQSLFLEKPVETYDDKRERIKRWYYIDMKGALSNSNDSEEFIKSFPEDKKIRNFRNEIIRDVSISEREFESEMFPLNKIFNHSGWRRGYNEYWKHDQDKSKFYDRFEEEIIERFKKYKLPIIKLLKGTPREAVCLIFEKVNTGGVSLTVFELLTATFAMDDFYLREDWQKHEREFSKLKNLSHLQNTDFLQAVTLLVTKEHRSMDLKSGKKEEEAKGIGCKRKDVLDLSVENYKKYAQIVKEGFIKASRLLYAQKIFFKRDLPYSSQLVPLAAILAELGSEAENDNIRNKLLIWYWCGVFGELYGSATESRFAKDLPEVLNWIKGGLEPSTVIEANFRPQRLLTLNTRNSAAYKGLFTLLMKEGCLDFKTGEQIQYQLYFDDKIDIHHIFPHSWCQKNKKDPKICNSIINKTPLSAKTNRIIGGKAPSEYLENLKQNFGITQGRLENILKSHLINLHSLDNDNYEGFLQHRSEELMTLIESAMGKKIIREPLELGSSIETSGMPKSSMSEAGKKAWITRLRNQGMSDEEIKKRMEK